MIVALAGRNPALVDRLSAAGHTVLPLPRVMGRLPGVDVVVDLTGRATRTLLDRILDLPRRPGLFLSPDPAARAATLLGVRVILLRPADDVFPLIRKEAV
ncbi:MAG TPA: hypothetical protein VF950_03645 [Planctomycetota bacterium]